jgi:hypothetical protein
MAAVKGIKEKVHLPLYDSVSIKPKEQLSKILSSNVLRFFLDVTGKTKLQTNMQASSLLPHWNTYEARAMRVVISDLPAQVPDTPTVETKEFEFAPGPPPERGKLTFSMRHFVDLKREVAGLGGVSILLDTNQKLIDRDLKFTRTSGNGTPDGLDTSESIVIDRLELRDIEEKLKQVGQVAPPPEQISPNNGFGNLIGKFVYNTVTTFFVGEKIMIQVPTWFFPAGAGPYSEDGRVTTHGYPNPQATFRFAEPAMIDAQQNFRVEIEVPESEVLSELQRLYGPLLIWVILDGYMTRDVQ